MSADEFLNKSTQSTNYLIAMANEVILKESPVSVNTIGARILEACAIEKPNKAILERINYISESTRIKPVEDGGTAFYFKRGEAPESLSFYRRPAGDYVRKAEDIYSGEAAFAILDAIREQFGIPEAESLVAGARKLGITRMTPAAKDLMERGMAILKNENAVTLDSNGMLQCKTVL